MKLAMLGLGRMGGNMARRLMAAGHEIVAFDRDPEAVTELVGEGAQGAKSIAEAAKMLGTPAIFWLMLPAGEITEAVMREVAEVAEPGGIVIDGGNSFWKHDLERSKYLAKRGLH